MPDAAKSVQINLVDCTLRDGGYYNDWNFSNELIEEYFLAMQALEVDYIEVGFRTLINEGFKGGCAFSTDSFIESLPIPEGMRDKIGVMVNGKELVNHPSGLIDALENLFPAREPSPVRLVRIACHYHEFEECLPAVEWLKQQGYLVGINLMQIADRSNDEIIRIANIANQHPLDVLYFADSMGSLNPDAVSSFIHAFKTGWHGNLGIHTHDNMGHALANSTRAVRDGVTWVDGTVTGMGRGPGNAKIEYLSIELESCRNKTGNHTKLLEVIREYFQPLQANYCWGTNTYYYLAGKYGIHPSYVQEMLGDSRYKEEDILAVINHLKAEGGKKFSVDNLEAARHFYSGDPSGSWNPKDMIEGRDVLILGSGPGVAEHKLALEAFIEEKSPFVIALNTQNVILEDLINIRAACHPVRLLADCQVHLKLPQPLATPASMLPQDVVDELEKKALLDFGLTIIPGKFAFNEYYCIVPTSLVIAYALAIATSGRAKSVLLAGFDGYGADDPRRHETDQVFIKYQETEQSLPLLSITPTLYEIPVSSIYALVK